jgi:hypothetical protein
MPFLFMVELSDENRRSSRLYRPVGDSGICPACLFSLSALPTRAHLHLFRFNRQGTDLNG